MDAQEVVCPKCGEAEVAFDSVAGVTACEACGAVLSDEQFVHGVAWQDEGPPGTFVGGTDTGGRVGGWAGGCAGGRAGKLMSMLA